MKPGDTLAQYRIDERTGAGGMGEVYKARDTKLNRTVALKLLPAESVSEPERRERLVREARAASALDHPNIITVHDIAEAEGQHFIVMQYVEGKTLRELVGGMKLSDALDYAIQMADALAAAHARHIIHRDLKPDNIMVGNDGQVTILDFGLARLSEPPDPGEAQAQSEVATLTGEGAIAGTLPYMSPEQAEGRKVDARSDIFSFGSILYEMVTGRRAFSGESATELLTAIIRDEPPKPSELIPPVQFVPSDLEKLITRALRKDPKRRFQSVADVKVELLEIQEELDSAADEGHRARGARTWARWAAPSVLVVLVVVVCNFFRAPSRPLPRTVPLTSYAGLETDPALSPDGMQVAFVWDGGEKGHQHLYVKLVDGGEPLKLTKGDVKDWSPAWHPDGTRIAFLRETEGGGHDVLEISALGGQPHRLGSSAGSNNGLSWSPDGGLLAMVDKASKTFGGARDGIFLLSTASGEKQELSVQSGPAEGSDAFPRFSPDGQSVAFARGQTQLFLVSLEGHSQPLSEGAQTLRGLDWASDGRSIVFSTSRQGPFGSGRMNLWRAWIESGKTEPVMAVGEGAAWPSIARAGNRLAYETWPGGGENDIWRIPGPALETVPRMPERLISSSREDWLPAFSPDGERIVFISDRSGHQEVWVSDKEGSNLMQLTFLEDNSTYAPSWSPDGERIAFMSPKEGSVDIYLVSSAGGAPHRLTTGTSREMFPEWSRDGQWIYFFSQRRHWKISVEGGEALPVAEDGRGRIVESDDGRLLYYTKGQDYPGVWRKTIDGEKEVRVLEQEALRPWDWVLLHDGIYCVNRSTETAPTIEFFELASGRTRRVASLEKGLTTHGFSVSPDGKWILLSQSTPRNIDLMLVENFQ